MPEIPPEISWTAAALLLALVAIVAIVLLARARAAYRAVMTTTATLAERSAMLEARNVRANVASLVDALPLPAALIDATGGYRHVNRRFEEWMEVASSELIGRPAAEVEGRMGPAVREEELAEVRAGRRAVREISAGLRSARSFVTVTLTPHPDEPGSLLIVDDASLQRRAEDQWRRAEATTSAILEAAVDGIVTIDVRGRVESFNKAAERIFGYSADEVIGRNVSLLMPEPYHSAHDLYLQNYLSTGHAKIIGIGREVQGRRKNGSTFPMDLAVGESRIGGRRIFAGIIRDITDRKRTEERLRNSEERLRLLVESVRDYAITSLDIEGRVTSWNTGAERMFGWSADEIVGQDFSCFFSPEAVSEGLPGRALAAVRETGRHEAEGWRLRKDGSRFWAHIVMTPLLDDAGALQGYVRVMRDMSEQRKVEADLMRAKEEADRAREEAERANLAKSKFLAAASHDLRQPVQALFFFTSALAHKLRANPAKQVLDDLERSLDSLNILLDSLLDISKLDAGIVTPKETKFAVASLLERIEADFEPAAAQKNLELRVVQSSLAIRSDPALLSRIVQNLVANAIRYTQRGKVLVGCRRRGGQLRIEVWDTGIGIPATQLKDVFQEFYQIGNQERDRTQGLGLGLAIVERLARLLGVHIDARSQLDRGSVFAVEVPLADKRVKQPAPAVARTAAEVASGRLIMIIDDELSVLRGLRLILEDWGFEVLAASSEDEAMELLNRYQRQPNAIVADYRLRDGRTGTDAIRHIRDLFHAPIPSIIITGDTAPERMREAEASGLSILHKPVQPPQLCSLLATTLGNA
ncbi:MAG: PAS domain S-box protein [Rhodospirillales bacterium]|nr:PAS domain S-box protein [Rhodospirillales bacterium]